MSQVSGMIVIPASLRSDFIHIAGMPIHIPLESIIHIAGIRRMTGEHSTMTDSKHEALKKKLEEIKSKLLSELKNESSIPINRAEGSFGRLRPSYSAQEIQK